MATRRTPPPVPSLTPAEFLRLFRVMALAREFDNEMFRLYRQGHVVGGAFPGVGNEATAVGSAAALEEQDVLFPMHREIGAHFMRGQTAEQLLINHLGRVGTQTFGVDGTGHYADPAKGIYGNISHLGAMIPVATGVALAAQLDKQPIVVMNYIGDGGSQTGEFHEGVNFAAVRKLPFVLIIENNQYAYSTPNALEFACKRLSDRALGYGCFGETVDGTDLEAVYRACKTAVDRARTGLGPSLVECVTMRMRGHAEHDDASYVPKSMVEEWKKKDPIDRASARLVKLGVSSKEDVQSVIEDARSTIKRAVDVVVPLPPVEPGPDFLKVFAP
jgi:TPP-dependent pyruvate/acetoin dehydrogenase alpha subunit